MSQFAKKLVEIYPYLVQWAQWKMPLMAIIYFLPVVINCEGSLDLANIAYSAFLRCRTLLSFILEGECMAFLASGSKPNYSDTAIFESIIMMPFQFVFILHNYYNMQMMVIIEKYKGHKIFREV